jgi:hypothetical protein
MTVILTSLPASTSTITPRGSMNTRRRTASRGIIVAEVAAAVDEVAAAVDALPFPFAVSTSIVVLASVLVVLTSQR